MQEIRIYTGDETGKTYKARKVFDILINERTLKRFFTFLLSFLFFSCAGVGSESIENKNTFDPAEAVIQFYYGPLNHLESVRSGPCPMIPSCSEYSIRCFKKHGFFAGYVMTFDRLIRCGHDELYLAPEVLTDHGQRCFDPVENNDFWWYKGKE